MPAALTTIALSLAASACQESTGPAAPCFAPAPLTGEFDPAAPSFIVLYVDGVDAVRETARLAAAYHFTPRHIYTAGVTGFSAELSQAALGRMRCTSSIRSVSYNARLTLGGDAE